MAAFQYEYQQTLARLELNRLMETKFWQKIEDRVKVIYSLFSPLCPLPSFFHLIMHILNTIRALLTAHYFAKSEQVQPYKVLRTDFGLTSLDFTELVVYLEQTFQIALPDAELDRVRSVADLAACVERHLQPVYS